jgi:hypothetical protein
MANEINPQNADDRSGLLTPEEREACGRIAAGNAPHSQRALALMALDQGVGQAEAGELSGLTKGQVRYWRDRFRDNRLGIFPNDLLAGKDVAGPKKKAAKQAFESEVAKSSPAVSAAKKDGKPKKKKKSKKNAVKAEKKKAGKPKSSAKGKKRKKKRAKKGKQAKKGKSGKAKSPAEARKKPKKGTKKAKKNKSKDGKDAKA